MNYQIYVKSLEGRFHVYKYFRWITKPLPIINIDYLFLFLCGSVIDLSYFWTRQFPEIIYKNCFNSLWQFFDLLISLLKFSVRKTRPWWGIYWFASIPKNKVSWKHSMDKFNSSFLTLFINCSLWCKIYSIFSWNIYLNLFHMHEDNITEIDNKEASLRKISKKKITICR